MSDVCQELLVHTSSVMLVSSTFCLRTLQCPGLMCFLLMPVPGEGTEKDGKRGGEYSCKTWLSFQTTRGGLFTGAVCFLSSGGGALVHCSTQQLHACVPHTRSYNHELTGAKTGWKLAGGGTTDRVQVLKKGSRGLRVEGARRRERSVQQRMQQHFGLMI